jgi:8-oxo-dGTP diphosphatase
MEETAIREVKEETGLEVGELELISVADEMRYIKSDDKHYVNIGFKAKHQGGEPQLVEPERWKEWRWFSLEKLPKPLFEGTELNLKAHKTGKIYLPHKQTNLATN